MKLNEKDLRGKKNKKKKTFQNPGRLALIVIIIITTVKLKKKKKNTPLLKISFFPCRHFTLINKKKKIYNSKIV